MRRFMNLTFFRVFSALMVFNHLTDLVGDTLEITDERHDGPVGDDLEDAEVIPDYNIEKGQTNLCLINS